MKRVPDDLEDCNLSIILNHTFVKRQIGKEYTRHETFFYIDNIFVSIIPNYRF